MKYGVRRTVTNEVTFTATDLSGNSISGTSTITVATLDYDDDGIPDDIETAVGLNPLIKADALEDLDGDGISNLDEYLNGTDFMVDSTPPVVTPPTDMTVDSTGALTEVTFGIATADDLVDGPVSALANITGPFVPGMHTVTWSATDAEGNIGTATQSINVIPLVSLGQDIYADEGSTVLIPISLNGDAVQYPVLIPYTVSGTALEVVDHDLSNGVIQIDANSNNAASINVTLLTDTVIEGVEDILITLGAPMNAVAGSKNELKLFIVEENYPPIVKLEASQNSIRTRNGYQDGGLITVEAVVSDPNYNDTHIFDWSLTDNAIVDTSSDLTDSIFMLDPATVSSGIYTLKVTVTDSSGSSSIQGIDLKISVVSPLLSNVNDSDGDGISDQQEGTGDLDYDGIPDYLDAIPDSNTAPIDETNQSSFVLQTEVGLHLAMGSTAFATNTADVVITESELDQFGQAANGVQKADTFINVGGIFDFIISGLSLAGQSVDVVIPLKEVIPSDPLYRKFMTNTGWFNFVVNQNNRVMSAPGIEGVCPAPNDVSYVVGMIPGSWCIQLTLEDGGPNDADLQANGSIVDPSGVATTIATVPPVLSSMSAVTLTEDNGGTSVDLFQYVTDTDSQLSDLQFSIINASQIAADFGVSIGFDGTSFKTRSDNSLRIDPASGFIGTVPLTIQAKDESGNLSNQVNINLTISAAPVVPPATSSSGGGGGFDMYLLLLMMISFAGYFYLYRNTKNKSRK